MRATLKLLNNYFWKTAYGPILAFIFPTLLLGILGNIMRIEYVLPGIIAIISLFIAVQAMPLGLMEMKNSTLLKYIGSSPIDSRKFTFTIILYYIIINIISITLLLLMGSIIFYKKVFIVDGIYSGIFTPIGFFSFVCANILHIILSLSVGMAIATFSKTPQQALTVALIVIIPSMFLSGMVLSADIIAESQPMQWISRFIPFRYTTGNIVVATTPAPQIGDLMSLLKLSNKQLIFNIIGEVKPGGQVHYFGAERLGLIIEQNGTEFWQSSDITTTSITGSTDFTFKVHDGKFAINIHDMKRLYHEQPELWNKAKTLWFQSSDSTLFKSIFMRKDALTGSDNNMFKWTGTFGVRKIPNVTAIQAFIQNFFKGESDQPGRFVFIWQNFIQKNDYSFLDLFMKQQVVLYENAERILNFFIPVILTILFVWYSLKKFAWSAR